MTGSDIGDRPAHGDSRDHGIRRADRCSDAPDPVGRLPVLDGDPTVADPGQFGVQSLHIGRRRQPAAAVLDREDAVQLVRRQVGEYGLAHARVQGRLPPADPRGDPGGGPPAELLEVDDIGVVQHSQMHNASRHPVQLVQEGQRRSVQSALMLGQGAQFE